MFHLGKKEVGEAIHLDSPNGSILRATGAEGGRLGPSIIIGGDGAPPLTGEGPYESPVTIEPSIYQNKRTAADKTTSHAIKRSCKKNQAHEQDKYTITTHMRQNWRQNWSPPPNRKQYRLQWFFRMTAELMEIK